MRYNKRSIVIGALVALAAMGFVLYERQAFLSAPKYGLPLFVLTLFLAFLSGLALAFRPLPACLCRDKERGGFSALSRRASLREAGEEAGPLRFAGETRDRGAVSFSYRLRLLGLLLLAPFVMVIAVERLNGNFLTDLYGWDYVADNYMVALVFYLALFALSGSVRISVISVSCLLFAFGVVNMYIKEFKGSPFLPLDAGSIATASKVAGQYTYDIGFEITFSAVLTLLLVALAVPLAMPPRSRRTKLALRLGGLVVVIVTAGIFYGTGLPVTLGMKPDFFNQMRGYENRGAIREFVNNTRYLRLAPPEDYRAEEMPALVEELEQEARRGGEAEAPYILDSAQLLQGTKSASTEDGADKSNSNKDNAGKDSAGKSNSDKDSAGKDSNPSAETAADAAKSTTAKAGATKNNNTAAGAAKSNDKNSATQGGADKNNTKNKETPDIIVVMNESFADLGTIGDFDSGPDPLPYLHSLFGAKGEGDQRPAKDVICGYGYVSVRGTGTSNSEYEFLTGNSMAFLPAGSNAYQLYLRSPQTGLVSTLAEQGYYAEASHPYFASNWNRPAVYELLGFERYTAMEDMFPAGYGGEYLSSGSRRFRFLHQVENDHPEITAVVGGNLSDAFGYKKLEEAYEARDKSRPYFHFHITMQNHSPYDEMYNNFPSTVEIASPEGDFPEAEQFLSREKESDRALQDLIAYFKKVDHPVILLFFGDHQPVVEEEFLGAIFGKDFREWTNEEAQILYQTPFVLWANYDIPEGYIDKISLNYLSTLLLQTAELEMPAYNDYLARLYGSYPVITAQGCRDAKDRFFLAEMPLDEAGEEALGRYAKLAYNGLTDAAHRVEEFFHIEK